LAGGSDEPVGDGAQHEISAVVPPSVVDLLEVVHVGSEQDRVAAEGRA